MVLGIWSGPLSGSSIIWCDSYLTVLFRKKMASRGSALAFVVLQLHVGTNRRSGVSDTGAIHSHWMRRHSCKCFSGFSFIPMDSSQLGQQNGFKSGPKVLRNLSMTWRQACEAVVRTCRCRFSLQNIHTKCAGMSCSVSSWLYTM